MGEFKKPSEERPDTRKLVHIIPEEGAAPVESLYDPEREGFWYKGKPIQPFAWRELPPVHSRPTGQGEPEGAGSTNVPVGQDTVSSGNGDSSAATAIMGGVPVGQPENVPVGQAVAVDASELVSTVTQDVPVGQQVDDPGKTEE